MRPAATPVVYTTSPRVSTPGRPPGMVVKSPCPASFCCVVKEQWSVETVFTRPSFRPAHSAS